MGPGGRGESLKTKKSLPVFGTEAHSSHEAELLGRWLYACMYPPALGLISWCLSLKDEELPPEEQKP